MLEEIHLIRAHYQMSLPPNPAGSLNEDWHLLFIAKQQNHISYANLSVFLNFVLFGKNGSVFLHCSYVEP